MKVEPPLRNNSGKGRPQGSRNKVTAATLALIADSESPLALMVKVLQDPCHDLPIRLNAARWAAPYLHPRPFPEMPTAEFKLPDNLEKPDALKQAHENILRAVASGELEVPLAKDLSSIIEAHRRIVETVDLEVRISKLESETPK
jgi:hypothetical protein